MYDRLLFVSCEKLAASNELNFAERLAPRSALLVYMQSGKCDTRCDYDRFTINGGEALLVTERTDFSLRADVGAEFYLMRFAADFEGDLPFTLREAPEFPRPEDDARLATMFTELCRISKSLEYPEEACDYLMRLIIIELARPTRESDESDVYPKIMKYITDNASTDITAAKVAREFGYSPDHIARGFKEYFGRGLKSAIDTARLGCIREKLLDESLDNNALAEACGFKSYKSLAEFFKYNTSMSIADYRKGKK